MCMCMCGDYNDFMWLVNAKKSTNLIVKNWPCTVKWRLRVIDNSNYNTPLFSQFMFLLQAIVCSLPKLFTYFKSSFCLNCADLIIEMLYLHILSCKSRLRNYLIILRSFRQIFCAEILLIFLNRYYLIMWSEW